MAYEFPSPFQLNFFKDYKKLYKNTISVLAPPKKHWMTNKKPPNSHDTDFVQIYLY